MQIFSQPVLGYIAGMEVFAERAAGSAGDDVGAAEFFEGEDIGLVRDVGGVEGMAHPVTGEDGDIDAVPFGADDGGAGFPEWGAGVIVLAFGVLQEGLTEAGAADQGDFQFFHVQLLIKSPSGRSKHRPYQIQEGGASTAPTNPRGRSKLCPYKSRRAGQALPLQVQEAGEPGVPEPPALHKSRLPGRRLCY